MEDNDIRRSFAANLARLLSETGIKQVDIARRLHVSEGAVSAWCSGAKIPRMDKIDQLAALFNVSRSYLLEEHAPLPDNVVPYVPAGRVPLVGDIACGEPILAEQNIVDYVDVPGHIKADYALTCHGESMINLGIMDGDIVYVRQQEIVNNGQIAAVIIDDEEATLKRFHYDGSTLVLIPANDRLAPRVFEREAMNRVRVLGLAVGFTHVFDNK